MIPRSSDFSLESVNKEYCVIFFKELFSIDELKDKIKQFSPEKLVKTSKNKSQGDRKSFFEIMNISQMKDKTNLAEILYDLVGPHFLYEIQGVGAMDTHSKNFRYEIFKKAIELGWFNIETISKVVKKLPRRDDKGIKDLSEINSLKIPGPWQHSILTLIPSKFSLPSEVAEAPSVSENKKGDIETIIAIRELRPLHDYQIFAGKKITDLLVEQNNIRKRLLISIPTGAGKTRLVAESLIDWMNAGKPSADTNIKNSKYMIWIAQSRELCEQAISQFEEIYSQKGQSALTIFRFFGDRKITLNTILSKRVEHGLIVCTIDKIYRHIQNIKGLSEFNKEVFQDTLAYDDKVLKSEIPQKFYDDFMFGKLRNMTSCVVVDEAHKAIMPTYTCVLRGLGFNFSYKDEQKCNEAGITLVGLTATAFRGTGLERSRKVVVGKSTQNKVKLLFHERGQEKFTENVFPLLCTECNKPLSEGETVLQSTSNNKLVWHTNEQKLSRETVRIYSRFSEPLIPKIYAFTENRKPKAIITCNEKCVAKDPIRISGEKSYDLLGSIVKYSWAIEKKSSLTEVFGIEDSNQNSHPTPENLSVIVEELENSGYYKISLTVQNNDALEDTATKIIEVIPKQQTETSSEMKELIQNLIKREILCQVFHTYIKSGKINIKIGRNEEIDLGGQIRKKAEENDTRNEKLVKSIHYLLTMPREKRKKILVFACGISHARFLTMWLKIAYNISAEYVDSDLHESRNISRIRKFREKSEPGKPGKVLINTNMLTTGFDVPDVDCVVMGRPVISTVEYTQMIGRGMRGPRMAGTKEVWIVDFDDQIQLSEQMKNQAITLGWKSMAYDSKNKLTWKSLSEKTDENGVSIDLELRVSSTEPQKSIHVDKFWTNEKIFSTTCQSCEKTSEGILGIFRDYELTDNEKEELGKFAESGDSPKLYALKFCTLCKRANEKFPDINHPWRKLIVKEYSNPVLLELVRYITVKGNGISKIDTRTILNAEYFLNEISRHNSNLILPELQQLEKEIDSFEQTDIEIMNRKIEDAKNKITQYRLADFWPEYVILNKDLTRNLHLISLCHYYLKLNPLSNLLGTKISDSKDHSLEELKNETNRIIFDVLGFIPEEDKFKEIIKPELYDRMISTYTTYHRFQQTIGVADIVIKLAKRSEYLNILIGYFNKSTDNPSVEVLELLFPDFRKNVKKYFGKSKTFFTMMNKIRESSQKFTNSPKYDDLKNDYEYVKSLTPYTPRTEEILRHSKVGIGQYMRYAGTISNFQYIYELVDDEIRLKLEKLKNSFFVVKESIQQIPDEETMKKHTDYSIVMESLDFDSYDDFLKFLGQKPKSLKQTYHLEPKKESKDKIVANAKAFVKSNGMSEFFERLCHENVLKYNILFGSIDEFIQIIFPDNKQVASMRWRDTKNKSQSKN